MSVDLNLFDYTDVYPDGELPISADGVREDFDLSKHLTVDYGNTAVWKDAFDSFSKLMYEKVEQHRRGVRDSRDPGVLKSPFKPMHLRMLGLDYKAENITDKDYERISEFYRTYAKTTKSRDAFIKFLGFAKGLRTDLVRLWTQDYTHFSPGHGKTVFDGGEWYPTSHVGMLYEEPEDGSSPDLEDLTNLFYILAPIHLILKWIGTLVTIRLPDLGVDMPLAIDEERVNVTIGLLNKFTMYPLMLSVEEECDGGTFPDWVENSAVYTDLAAVETVVEYSRVTADTVNWIYSEQPTTPDHVSFYRSSPASYIDKTGRIVWVYDGVPRLKHHSQDGTLQGWLFEPERYGFLRSPLNLNAEPWERINVFTHPENGTFGPDDSFVKAIVAEDSVVDPDTAYFEQTIFFSDTDFMNFVFQAYSAGTGDAKLTISWQTSNGEELGTYAATWGSAISVSGTDTGYSSIETVYPTGWKKAVFGVWRPEGAVQAVVRFYPFTDLADTRYLYYIGMENGTVETTPLYGEDCDLGYRAPERLRFDSFAKTAMANNHGFFLMKGKKLGNTVDTAFHLGESDLEYATLEVAYADSTFKLVGKDVYNDAGVFVASSTIESLEDNTSGVFRIGWSWDSAAKELLVSHNGIETLHTANNPLVSNISIVGACPKKIEFWGILQRVTLAKIELSPVTLDSLLA